jgi:hypothetical protein
MHAMHHEQEHVPQTLTTDKKQHGSKNADDGGKKKRGGATALPQLYDAHAE